MSTCCSNHDDDIVIRRKDYPFRDGHDPKWDGETINAGSGPETAYADPAENPNWVYNRGINYLRLAEHMMKQRTQEADELDRIAVDLFARPWLDLTEAERNATRAVHQRYTRNDDIPEQRP